MKNILRCALVFWSLILGCDLAFGQTEREIEEKFGKPMKSYQIGPGLSIVPQFEDNGQIWAATIYLNRVEISGNMAGVLGNAFLPWEELKKALDEIVPTNVRGKLKNFYEENTSGIRSATYDYENVSIEFISFKKEEEIAVGTFDLDPQKSESAGVTVKKEPRSRLFPETVSEFKSPIASSCEFVRIIWLNRNVHKK